MKRIIPALLIFGLLTAQDCEPSGPGPDASPYCYGSPTVYKQVTDVAGDFWALLRGEASIDRRATLRMSMPGYRCTGVALDAETAITAAHCTWGSDAVSAVIDKDLENIGSPNSRDYFDAVSWKEHPEYARYKQSGNVYAAGRYSDLSVVKLKGSRINPDAPLPEPYVDGFFDPLDPNDAGHCVRYLAQGWGQWEEATLSLREGEYHVSTVTDTSVNTFIRPDGPAICFGDSGGPLYAEMSDGSLKLVGITSTTMSSDCLKGSTHVRVSPLFSEWIEGQ